MGYNLPFFFLQPEDETSVLVDQLLFQFGQNDAILPNVTQSMGLGSGLVYPDCAGLSIYNSPLCFIYMFSNVLSLSVLKGRCLFKIARYVC